MNYFAYAVILMMAIHTVHQVIGLFNKKIGKETNATNTINIALCKVMDSAGPLITNKLSEAIIYLKIVRGAAVVFYIVSLIIGLVFAPEVNKWIWVMTCVISIIIHLRFITETIKCFQRDLQKITSQ